jgi:hypothetical protein
MVYGFEANVKAQQNTILNAEGLRTQIVIDATVDSMTDSAEKIVRICWNTGEEKNCPGCYLSKGCKAKE